MKPVLVINSGSSSLKYQLIDVEAKTSLDSGLIERVTDHRVAFEQMLSALSGPAPIAVGHRVVHGGSLFPSATIVNEKVLEGIESLSDLAPLHNPGNLAGVRAAMEAFPELPQVVVFDTAFHQTMPISSYRYAIPLELEKEHQLRRYGFHGTSYAYVTKKAAEFIGKPVDEFNAIILHLGNGASACAIKNGKSFDTSMGLTPLQGLVMGTRSGDIDPAVFSYLNRVAGLGVQEIDDLLNKKSGLAGLTGASDLRDVIELSDAGNEDAKAALAIYAQRIKHYIGAFAAELGRIDALVFTAGVGENSVLVRSLVTENLDLLGIKVDEERNIQRSSEARSISHVDATVHTLVVPTNEELEIAIQVAELCL